MASGPGEGYRVSENNENGQPGDQNPEQHNGANGYCGMSRQELIWWCLFVSLMILGTLFMLIDVGIALFCLHDHGYTTALCSVQSESFAAADELRLVAETMEPVISVFIVISVMVLTCRNRSSCPRCCESNVSWRILVSFYWFSTYCITMLASFVYYITVFAFNVSDHLEGSLRYLTLPLGMTSWFVWMVTLNELGATTTHAGVSDVLSVRFYTALLIFAGMTNFVEFVIYTIYLAGTLTTVGESLNLLPYLEIVGQSLVVSVRYGMASFYLQMVYIGEEGHQLLKDPWLENNASEVNDASTTGSSVTSDGNGD
ncbi:uncharacterized protein [Ptychodera flava]|uniref:uncharacterized protein n=1 Tax=Ptychodera flava TaxID=63121 RepID=UPI003969DCDD